MKIADLFDICINNDKKNELFNINLEVKYKNETFKITKLNFDSNKIIMKIKKEK